MRVTSLKVPLVFVAGGIFACVTWPFRLVTWLVCWIGYMVVDQWGRFVRGLRLALTGGPNMAKKSPSSRVAPGSKIGMVGKSSGGKKVPTAGMTKANVKGVVKGKGTKSTIKGRMKAPNYTK